MDISLMNRSGFGVTTVGVGGTGVAVGGAGVGVRVGDAVGGAAVAVGLGIGVEVAVAAAGEAVGEAAWGMTVGVAVATGGAVGAGAAPPGRVMAKGPQPRASRTSMDTARAIDRRLLMVTPPRSCDSVAPVCLLTIVEENVDCVKRASSRRGSKCPELCRASESRSGDHLAACE
jgi:hypothetical protein